MNSRGNLRNLLSRLLLVAIADIFFNEKGREHNKVDGHNTDAVPPLAHNAGHVVASNGIQEAISVNGHDNNELGELATGDERAGPTLWAGIVQVHDEMDDTVDPSEATGREVMSDSSHGEGRHMVKPMQPDDLLAREHKEVGINPLPDLRDKKDELGKAIPGGHRSHTTGHIMPRIETTILDSSLVDDHGKHPEGHQRQSNVVDVLRTVEPARGLVRLSLGTDVQLHQLHRYGVHQPQEELEQDSLIGVNGPAPLPSAEVATKAVQLVHRARINSIKKSVHITI